MRPPQLHSTSPVKGNSHSGNSYPERADHAVHPVERSCDDDSGFFDDYVQQQGATIDIPQPSVARGSTIFGKGEDASKDLRKKIDEAFERHQPVPADDHEKDASGAETSKTNPQNYALQVSPLLGEHEQRPDDPDILPPSSAHGKAGYEHATRNDDTAAGDSTDSEATSVEDAGTSSDYEELSLPDSVTFLKRESGEESQVVPQKSTASVFRRASGQESQEIPEYEVGELDGCDMSEELQPIGSNNAGSLYRRTAGQESQEIPKESVTEQYGKQLPQEPQDFLDSEPATPARQGLSQNHMLGSPTELQGLLKRATGEKSQVLPLQALQHHIQFASSAPEQAPVSRTPTRAQSSTTSVYATPKAPRFSSSPLAREPATQRKRKFSEPAHSELSAIEKGLSRAPLQIRLRNDDETANEVPPATDRTRASSTPAATATDDHGVESDTIVVNMSQNTRSSKRRRVQDDAPSTLPLNPKVVFSLCSIHKKTNTMESFYKLGGEVVDNVAEADILCVPNISAKTELKKTPKLLLAVILGKAIVTERWIVDCHRTGQQTRKFPDPASYIPLDTERERSWKFNLKAALKEAAAQLEHSGNCLRTGRCMLPLSYTRNSTATGTASKTLR